MTENKTKYFTEEKLLTPPQQRAAYSDRMAYVCAELSRIAYFPFEGGARLENVLDYVETIVGDDKQKEVIRSHVKELLGEDRFDEAASKAEFEKILALGGMALVDTFNVGDTQGFVCTHRESEAAFLVYRGTESINDALDDVNAFLTSKPFEQDDSDNSKVHRGFYHQFLDADEQVKDLLAKVEGKQLFITGHSLGGALAVLATRFYVFNSDGACYTFGAPATSNIDFQRRIKTPIYRIVNEADPVSRLPTPWVAFAARMLLRLIYIILAKFGVKKSITTSQLMSDLKQYRQIGYEGLLLRSGDRIVMRQGSSISSYDRLLFWVTKVRVLTPSRVKKLAEYHRMDHYVSRLRDWGNYRN